MRKKLYAVIERKILHEKEKSFALNFIITRVIVAKSTLTRRRDVFALLL
jgi:hypothetical protein